MDFYFSLGGAWANQFFVSDEDRVGRIRTPWGVALSERTSHGICKAPNLFVGTVVQATPYDKVVTAGGEPAGTVIHTELTLQTERTVRGVQQTTHTIHVRGGVMPDGRTVATPPEQPAPIVGNRYALGYWTLQQGTATWPVGTPIIGAKLRIDPSVPLPSESDLIEEVAHVCP